MKITHRKIRIERSVSESPRKVWERWTTREGLLTFFGGDNRVELRPGGPYEIYFLLDNPPGLRGSEGCRILSYLPKKMLSFSWNAPPQFKEIRESEYQTWVVILLEENDQGGTDLSLNHLGWPDDPAWDGVYSYFEKAWGRVIQSLIDAVEG